MPRCPETGLSIPECCCRTCIEEQLARHAPQLLEAEPATGTQFVEHLVAPSHHPPARISVGVR